MGRFSVLFFFSRCGEKELFCPPQGEGQHGLQSRPASHSRWIQLWLSERGRAREGSGVPFHLTVSQAPMNSSQWWQTNKASGRPTRGDTRLLWREFAHAGLTCGARTVTSTELAGGSHEMTGIIEILMWQHRKIHLTVSRQFTHWRKPIHSSNLKVHQLIFFFKIHIPVFLKHLQTAKSLAPFCRTEVEKLQ